MPFHILFKPKVNVRFANVPGDTPEEAIENFRPVAEHVFRLMFRSDFDNEVENFDTAAPETLCYLEYAEEISCALVDVPGDTEFKQSKWNRLDDLYSQEWAIVQELAVLPIEGELVEGDYYDRQSTEISALEVSERIDELIKKARELLKEEQ